ncbi:tau-tubulin kinase 1 [Anaeramoeba flamelloides]|uniref:non-specific serine/threonine protein kinase n=1 Tax=Anaeramoeba flamelloides TaxID=1746091 RepID=A0ABQ8Z1I1_9EUKA|nr:tau-tubulin kinase 1 [Anaeramoeba flamelloides]
MTFETLLKGRWKLLNKLGQGGFGEIFCVYDLDTQQKAAVKVERIDRNKRALRLEVAVLRKLQNSRFSARFICCGRNQVHNYLIMELLGSNLSSLRKKKNQKRFSLATTLKLGTQMISAIEDVHEVGFIHRDIKASNFTLRIPKNKKTRNSIKLADCCIIDFGLARKYINSEGKLREPREEVGFRGTTRYASTNSHEGKELSRRDDLWSLFYLFVEFIKGSLPWERLKDKEEIYKIKKKFTNIEMCNGLPEEFALFYKHIESLEYEDKPDYQYLRQLLQNINKRYGYDENTKYDWEISQEDLEIMRKSPSVTKSFDSQMAFSGTTNDQSRTQGRKLIGAFSKEYIGEIEKMNNIVFPKSPKSTITKTKSQNSQKKMKIKNNQKRYLLGDIENNKNGTFEDKEDNTREINEFERMMKMINEEEETETSSTMNDDIGKCCCVIF